VTLEGLAWAGGLDVDALGNPELAS